MRPTPMGDQLSSRQLALRRSAATGLAVTRFRLTGQTLLLATGRRLVRPTESHDGLEVDIGDPLDRDLESPVFIIRR